MALNSKVCNCLPGKSDPEAWGSGLSHQAPVVAGSLATAGACRDLPKPVMMEKAPAQDGGRQRLPVSAEKWHLPCSRTTAGMPETSYPCCGSALGTCTGPHTAEGPVPTCLPPGACHLHWADLTPPSPAAICQASQAWALRGVASPQSEAHLPQPAHALGPLSPLHHPEVQMGSSKPITVSHDEWYIPKAWLSPSFNNLVWGIQELSSDELKRFFLFSLQLRLKCGGPIPPKFPSVCRCRWILS